MERTQPLEVRSNQINTTRLPALDRTGPFAPFVDWPDFTADLGLQEDNAGMALGT